MTLTKIGHNLVLTQDGKKVCGTKDAQVIVDRINLSKQEVTGLENLPEYYRGKVRV